MLSRFACYFTALTLSAVFAPTVSAYVPSEYQSNYDEGYQFGFDKGHEVGWGKGYDSGVTDGTADGEEAGFDDGWDTAYQPAYDVVYGGAYEVGAAESYVVNFASGFVDGFREGEAYDEYLSSDTSLDLTLTNLGYGGNGGIFLSNYLSGYGNGLGRNNFYGIYGLTMVSVSDASFSEIDYSAYWYDEGYDAGYDEGIEVGEVEGYDAAYQPSFDVAYEAAFIEGESEGAEQGEIDGIDDGYNDGWDSTATLGEDDGFIYGFAFQQAGGSLEDLGLSQQQIAALESYNTLTSVPEPTTGLLALGLFASCGLVRRKHF